MDSAAIPTIEMRYNMRLIILLALLPSIALATGSKETQEQDQAQAQAQAQAEQESGVEMDSLVKNYRKVILLSHTNIIVYTTEILLINILL